MTPEPLTHGALFEGYGGTTMGAGLALGPLDTRWYSDIKPASVALLAHHHPGIPNLGDLTAIDFRRVEPVDLLTASWPCQPHSSAGKRLGAEDPRALWPHVLRAVAAVRPRIFLGENVARIATNGELERVARTLAAIGYVGAFRLHTADAIDAPHRRDRGFVAALDATDPHGWDDLLDRLADTGHGDTAGRLTLLPTPTQSMTTGPGSNGRDGGLNLQTAAVRLFPAPRESDGTKGGPGQRGSSGDLMLPSAAVSLLPTPTVADSRNSRNATARRSEGAKANDGWTLSDVAYADRWGVYAAAVARWERTLGRPAPEPTQPSDAWRQMIAKRRAGLDRRPVGMRGSLAVRPQLSPRFVEWMMGLPDGHVTGTGVQLSPNGRPASERNAMLSLLGDGVVPQQAAAAFTLAIRDAAAVDERVA